MASHGTVVDGVLDNRRSNLRFVTHSESNFNRATKGYFLDKSHNTWRVYVRRRWYGSYKTESEAKIMATKILSEMELREVL